MLTPRPPGPSRTAANATNLFLDADPDEHALAPGRSEQQRARTSRPGRKGRRGRGLLMPAGSSSSPTVGGRDAATFTRARLGAGTLFAAARSRLRRANVRAAMLLRRLAERRYGGLAAAALLAVVADLAELAGTRLARRVRCPQRRRARADRCDRGAHTRPGAHRWADRSA